MKLVSFLHEETDSDEFSYPPEIGVRSYVNGELRQTGNRRSEVPA